MTRLHSESGCWDAAICDQSQAFTKLLVPAWLLKYQAAPRLSAKLVFHLLPALLQASVSAETLVCACYMRLAMGVSHAVHILMLVNFRLLNSALHSQRYLAMCKPISFLDVRSPKRRRAPGNSLVDAETAKPSVVLSKARQASAEALVEDKLDVDEVYQGVSDHTWNERIHARLQGQGRGSGYSLLEWLEAVGLTKQSDQRTFVCMYLFGGEMVTFKVGWKSLLASMALGCS